MPERFKRFKRLAVTRAMQTISDARAIKTIAMPVHSNDLRLLVRFKRFAVTRAMQTSCDTRVIQTIFASGEGARFEARARKSVCSNRTVCWITFCRSRCTIYRLCIMVGVSFFERPGIAQLAERETVVGHN